MATKPILLPVNSAEISGDLISSGARAWDGDAFPKILFADDSTEQCVFLFEIPDDYDSSPKIVLKVAMVSATSGKVDFEAEVRSISANADDVDGTGFDTANEIAGGTTVPGTAGLYVEIELSLTNNDSLAAGDLVAIRVSRDHDDADDTATGDAELVSVKFKYDTA